MLVTKRFIELEDEDFFNTTNKPKELPTRAMMKITAYADVIPILMSAEMPPGCGGVAVKFGTSVTFVPKGKMKLIPKSEIIF